MTNILLNYYNFHEDWAFSHLSKFIDAKKSVTVLPLAFRDNQAWDNQSWQQLYGKNGEKYQKIIDPFLAFGIPENQITFVNFFAYTADMQQVVVNSDILLFTGGLPEKIMQRLNDLQLVDTIKNYKGVLLGVSAGAMVQLKNYHVTPDPDYAKYVAKNEGLGLVDGFDIEVHFENTKIQRKCAKKALADNKKPVFALWHQSGLIVQGDHITAIGKFELLS